MSHSLLWTGCISNFKDRNLNLIDKARCQRVQRACSLPSAAEARN